MRYDVRNLEELKAAVAECTAQDRIVIFFPDAKPVRMAVGNEHFHYLPCDARGDRWNVSREQLTTKSVTPEQKRW